MEQRNGALNIVCMDAGFGECEVVGGLEGLCGKITLEDELENYAGILPAPCGGEFLRCRSQVFGEEVATAAMGRATRFSIGAWAAA